jgi:hypothetical protein
MVNFRIIPNHDSDIYVDYFYPEGVLIPESSNANTIWRKYKDFNDSNCDNDYVCLVEFMIRELCEKNLESKDSIYKLFSETIEKEYTIYTMDDVKSIMNDTTSHAYYDIWDTYIYMLENIVYSYHQNGDMVFQ